MRKSLLICLCILNASAAYAHIGPKEVRRISFPSQLGQQTWIVIKNLGVFLGQDAALRWTCDESLSILGGMNDAAIVGAERSTWLVGDAQGLHRSRDDGCHFEPVGSPFDVHVIGRIMVSQADPNHVLVTTETLGEPNDIYLTEDGGETWTAAGLNLVGRIRSILRSDNDPDVVYLIHRDGGLRSLDGGGSFEPMAIAPMDAGDITGVDVDLLAIDQNNSQILYGSIARFPQSEFIRSLDGGDTWESISSIDDFPESLIVLNGDQEMIMATPILGLLKSTDQGQSWAPLGDALEQGWQGCLNVGPTGQVWSCVHRGEDTLVMRSETRGETWETVVRIDLQNSEMDRHCPEDSEAVLACEYTCDLYPQFCMDHTLSDMGIGRDSMVPHDGAITPRPMDAGGATGASRDNGCATVTGSTSSGILTWMVLGVLGIRRRLSALPG